MLLAGDIGGTKSTLFLFSMNGSSLEPRFRARLMTRDFSSPISLIRRFLELAAGERISIDGLDTISLACAGAVVEDRVVTNNLPWTVDAGALAKEFRVEPNRTLLLNDLVAAAASLPHLPQE